jgi:HAE1 family hydrophobic/amphiphilic exporter-1
VALGGARQRLRPILMTSFAFIFGLMPLWCVLGAGVVARRLIGTLSIVGMAFPLAAGNTNGERAAAGCRVRA